jgi:hypothetical protein
MSTCGSGGCNHTAAYLAVEVDESQDFLSAYSPDYWLVCMECKENVSVFGNVLLISLAGLRELL